MCKPLPWRHPSPKEMGSWQVKKIWFVYNGEVWTKVKQFSLVAVYQLYQSGCLKTRTIKRRMNHGSSG